MMSPLNEVNNNTPLNERGLSRAFSNLNMSPKLCNSPLCFTPNRNANELKSGSGAEHIFVHRQSSQNSQDTSMEGIEEEEKNVDVTPMGKPERRPSVAYKPEKRRGRCLDFKDSHDENQEEQAIPNNVLVGKMVGSGNTFCYLNLVNSFRLMLG
jgi:hypothetical protein